MTVKYKKILESTPEKITLINDITYIFLIYIFIYKSLYIAVASIYQTKLKKYSLSNGIWLEENLKRKRT